MVRFNYSLVPLLHRGRDISDVVQVFQSYRTGTLKHGPQHGTVFFRDAPTLEASSRSEQQAVFVDVVTVS